MELGIFGCNTFFLLSLLSLFIYPLQPEAISTFTSDAALVSFAKYFCEASENMKNVSWVENDGVQPKHYSWIIADSKKKALVCCGIVPTLHRIEWNGV